MILRFLLFSIFVIAMVFIIVPFVYKKYADYKTKHKSKQSKKYKVEDEYENQEHIGFRIYK